MNASFHPFRDKEFIYFVPWSTPERKGHFMAERNTRQKDMIYASLCTLHNHPTADQVYEDVHSTEPTVSRATVYRVLNRMAAQGRVRKMGVMGGADRFDGILEEHSHIHCPDCGKLFDIPYIGLNIDEFTKAEMADFEIHGYSLMVEGVCPKCLKKRNETV